MYVPKERASALVKNPVPGAVVVLYLREGRLVTRDYGLVYSFRRGIRRRAAATGRQEQALRARVRFRVRSLISAIKIRNFKGFHRSPWRELATFPVLLGPNGSAKSTFLDAIEFVRQCLTDGPAAAVETLVPEFRDLTFQRRGGAIEFDVRVRDGRWWREHPV